MKRYYFSLYGGSNKKQWGFLQHNGPMFPPPYVPHKIPVIVNNVKHILPPIAEEYITLYAKYHDSHHLMNNIFKKNFWKDFKLTLPENILLKVKSIDDIDYIQLDDAHNVCYFNSINKCNENHAIKFNNIDSSYYNYLGFINENIPVGIVESI